MTISYAPESKHEASRPKFNADPASIFELGKAPAGRKTVVGTSVASRRCGVTAASATVTCTDTTGLAVGMMVAGAGVSAGQAVTTQNTGDTFTLNSHGAPDGTAVYLTALATTTGFDLNKVYYVVGSAANTFQLAATPGGTPIVITADGTATVVFRRYVTAISANTSLTLNIPASATVASTDLRFATPPTAL